MPDFENNIDLNPASITEKYYENIFRFVLYKIKNRETAEDLTQEIFLKMSEILPNFRRESSIYTWLFGLAKNFVRNYKRKKLFSKQNLTKNIPDERTPEHNAISAFIKEEIYKAVTTLPEKQQQVFLLRQDGFPYKKIAKMLNISENSAKVNYFNSIQTLGIKLEHLKDDYSNERIAI